MLRALLLGLLVVVSPSACSKSSSENSAKVVPGQAAGKVLEVKGSVQIKRGAETKPLAVGDSVEASDVVVTGADGNVVIELAHNSARWELGPNKQQKVSESIAWNAKKATAEEIDQATAAAGRPAERNAAGTVATADEAEAAKDEGAPAPAAAEAAPASAAAPAAADKKADDDLTPKGGGGAPPPRRRAVAKAAAAAPPPPPAPQAEMATADDEAPPPRTRGATRGPMLKPEAPKSASADTATASAAPAPEKMRVMSRSVDPTAQANAALGGKSAALQKCLSDSGMKEAVTLSITITNGKPATKLSSKASISAKLKSCLEGVVNGTSFIGSATVTKTLKL